MIDIHISTKCESKYVEDSSIVNIWSLATLLGACGIQSLSFNPGQTQAYVYNANDMQIPIEEHLGRSGLYIEKDLIALRLSRIYNADMNFGGWGTETTLYSQGMYYQMHIWGAAYT